MQLEDFRLKYKRLVHFAPAAYLRIEKGLLSAGQVLDLNADANNRVRTRFQDEAEYTEYDVGHWKSHPRYRKGGGEAQSNLYVQDRESPERSYFLGNNHALGGDDNLGIAIPLTDNRYGDPKMTGPEWLRQLNRMFWVFIEGDETPAFVERVRKAAPERRVVKITLTVAGLSDDLLEGQLRLSAVNSRALGGRAPRGTATYVPLAWWSGRKPKEIGILDGVSADKVRQLQRDRALSIEEV